MDPGVGEDGEPAETVLDGGSHSQTVRVGRTVRRPGRPWSPSVLDLLRHVEREGFVGAPRAVGLDARGREVVTWVEGSVGSGPPEHDDPLVQLGSLLRRYHDAAATFAWAGRPWQLEVRHPVETICHNDLALANVVLRAGGPVALIDWEAAAPGPRVWDLGFAAWHWVPFWSDEKCRAAGLHLDSAGRSRRLRLFLDAYGMATDLAFVGSAVQRMQQFLEHLTALATGGSAWEVQLARRGVLDELQREITWVERHAVELVDGRRPSDS